MQPLDGQTLQETTLRMISKVAFLFGEPAAVEELVAPDSAVYSNIGFNGRHGGELSLAFAPTTAIEFTANYLGLVEEPSEVNELVLDAIGEFLNILCSHVLEQLLGEDTLFELELPVTKLLDQEGWTEFAAAPESHGLAFEDAPALIRLQVK